MKESDFKECDYIDTYLKFYTLEDFYKHRLIIRTRYKSLSMCGKMFYKWYVYANINMDLKQKDIVWEYLNNDALPSSLIYAHVKIL